MHCQRETQETAIQRQARNPLEIISNPEAFSDFNYSTNTILITVTNIKKLEKNR